MYGLILLYNEETEARIRGLWQRLATVGLPSTMPGIGHPPHVTLLISDELNVETALPPLRALAAGQAPLAVNFPGVSVFPGPSAVVYLAVTLDHPLMDLHERVWSVVEPHAAGLHDFDRPGVFVPHTTLDFVIPIEQTGAVIEELLLVDWVRYGPRTGVLDALLLAGFGPEFDGYREIERIPLGG